MKKKITVLTAGALCAASLAVGACASDVIKSIEAQLRPDFTVVVDGKTQNFKNANGETVYPVLYEGTTYLPVRAIGELMGKTVYWYEDDKRIELKSEGTTVTDADVIVPSGGSNETGPTSRPSTGSGGGSSSAPKNIYTGLEPQDGEISHQRAKEIALEKAGLAEADVFIEQVKLEYDDGRRVYDVEFRQGRTEYSADILASDGTIISWDVDMD